jgi:hypothetical protein
MTDTSRDNEEVQRVVQKIRSLRRLTVMTGTLTRRTQSERLASLKPDVLCTVAEILTEETDNASSIK